MLAACKPNTYIHTAVGVTMLFLWVSICGHPLLLLELQCMSMRVHPLLLMLLL